MGRVHVSYSYQLGEIPDLEKYSLTKGMKEKITQILTAVYSHKEKQ